MAYGPPIDRIIDLAGPSFTRRLWLKLAFAALDQADVTPGRLLDAVSRVRASNLSWEGILSELGETP